MSKAPRKTPPLASFDPILGALLREGSKAEVRIPHGSKKEATATKYQLNVYRQVAQKHNAPGWEMLYLAEVRSDEHDPTIVIIAPKNSLLRKRIEAIGIKLGQGPEDDFLKSLVDGKETT